jgi:hypothetical protein
MILTELNINDIQPLNFNKLLLTIWISFYMDRYEKIDKIGEGTYGVY